MPAAILGRYGPFLGIFLLIVVLDETMPQTPAPDSVWRWSVPCSVVVGVMLGWAYVAATRAGGAAASAAVTLSAWLGAGVVLAFFGMQGKLNWWGALFGFNFVAAIIPGATLVWLHRRGRLQLPRFRRARRDSELYGPPQRTDDSGHRDR